VADAVGGTDHRIGGVEQVGQPGEGFFLAAVVVDQAHAEAFGQLPVMRQQRGAAADAEHAAALQAGAAGVAFSAAGRRTWRAARRLLQPESFQRVAFGGGFFHLAAKARFVAAQDGDHFFQRFDSRLGFPSAAGLSFRQQQAATDGGHGLAGFQLTHPIQQGFQVGDLFVGTCQVAFCRIGLPALPAQFFREASIFRAQVGLLALQPFQPPQIGGLAGADLVAVHVDIAIDLVAGIPAGGLVGERGPHGIGDFAALQVLLPQGQHVGVGFDALEAGDDDRVLALQKLVHRFGGVVARAGQRDGFDMQAVGIEASAAEIAIKTALAGDLLEFIQREAGANHRAVVLFFEFPELWAAGRRLLARFRFAFHHRRDKG